MLQLAAAAAAAAAAVAAAVSDACYAVLQNLEQQKQLYCLLWQHLLHLRETFPAAAAAAAAEGPKEGHR